MYIERSDISLIIDDKKLAEITNSNSSIKTPNETAITEVMAYANNFIDDSLRGKYELPLNNIPTVLKDIAMNIFLYKLYERCKDKIEDATKIRYTRAIRTLKSYTTGNFLQLPVDVQKGKVSYSRVNSRDQKFSPEMLRKF